MFVTLFLTTTLISPIVFANVDVKANPCPEGWIQATSVDMGCLLPNRNEAMTWEAANVYCQKEENAALVELQTPDQMDYLIMELNSIEETLGTAFYWAGASDVGREGTWIWSSSLEPVEDFVWGPGEPASGYAGNCLVLISGYGYKGIDGSCEELYKWYPICQKMV